MARLGYSIERETTDQRQVSMTERVHGYAEGYYGRLFTWDERRRVIDTLSSNGQNTYYYAPKEDALHRWQWRTEYSNLWLDDFASFCIYATNHDVQVVAGVAPGLDFNFIDLPNGPDYQALSNKCRALLSAGAHHLSLLLDDIDEDFHQRCGRFSSEGQAHATLANALADEFDIPVWVTPRVYADELMVSDESYLPSFLETLQQRHTVLYCGSDVVTKQACVRSLEMLEKTPPSRMKVQRIVVWDNLYANDYCPRRLFVGPWQGRAAIRDVLVNPTGLVNTDCLLLDVMAAQIGLTDNTEDALTAWKNVLLKHGVPDAFFELAHYFYHPVFNNHKDVDLPQVTTATFEAIEQCLWRWKTPLAREWYGYIFGLKHDLLAEQNELPQDRIRKTQTVPLARTLLRLN
jgi:protein O-GlcNAcase/histone acetyltransferase